MPQVLKEEVRKAILAAALAEFYEKGFRKGSMRGIARRAGVAVGNVYRYFGSKEKVFRAVVEPAYKKVMKVWEHLGEVENAECLNRLMDEITARLVQIHAQHTLELRILVYGSGGSEYEGFRAETILKLSEKLERHLFGPLRERRAVRDPYLSYVVAAAFIEGLRVLLRRHDNTGQLREAAAEFCKFYFNDIASRFEDKGVSWQKTKKRNDK